MALTAIRVRAAALALALGLAASVQWLFPGATAALESRLADLAWRLAAASAPASEERVVLVDIDERSLAAVGPWPWPRARLAELADRLAEAGAAVQVYDLVLDAGRPDDGLLAARLRRHRAILAAAFAFPGQGEAVEAGRLDAAATPGLLPCRPPWPDAQGHRAPAAAFAGIAVGHIAPRVDPDGVVRAAPSHVCRNGQAWPALALAAYLAAAGAGDLRLEPGDGMLAAPWRLASAALPSAVPLGERGELSIPYALDAAAFPSVSAVDLLDGRVPADLLAGRIALVGSTAFGLGDAVATPLAGAQSGLLVHAELLSALLDERLPHPPRAAGLLAAGGALAAALPIWLLAWRRPSAYWLPLAGLALALLLLGMQLVLQLWGGLLVGLAAPALASLLAGLFLGSLEALRAGRENARLLGHLTSYLPAPLAARLLAGKAPDAAQAALVEASVLVADLRNFSAWAESRPPGQVAALLHRFLSVAVEAVEARGGVVEALQGDAILAVWNEDGRPCAGHAERALAAALDIKERMAGVLPPADPDGIPPPLALGIGLDSGPLLSGSIGPERRRQHVVLGLPVARALRLQAMTGELSSPVLAGPGLVARLGPAARGRFVSRGEFLLEGLRASCEIHALA